MPVLETAPIALIRALRQFGQYTASVRFIEISCYNCRTDIFEKMCTKQCEREVQIKFLTACHDENLVLFSRCVFDFRKCLGNFNDVTSNDVTSNRT